MHRITITLINMRQVTKTVLLTTLFSLSGGALMANDDMGAERRGAIRGRIVDASAQTLPGANIYIESLHTGVTSDVNGYYTFSNLAPGT